MSYLLFLLLAAGLVVLGMSANGDAAMAPSTSSFFEQKVRAFAEAIAYAEGFWDRNRNVHIDSRPARNNNPGDLEMAGDAGTDGVYGVYSSLEKGWEALYNMLRIDFTGRSTIYSPTMSISDYGWKYTTTQPDAWSENVASWLGVTRDTIITNWLQS